ncbi:hypothetical protein C8F01DRAFT_1076622 [Mycena amicta]|nr:hypothetical protein C8F01DRAFT_1076622 [Mycena amicta]
MHMVAYSAAPYNQIPFVDATRRTLGQPLQNPDENDTDSNEEFDTESESQVALPEENSLPSRGYEIGVRFLFKIYGTSQEEVKTVQVTQRVLTSMSHTKIPVEVWDAILACTDRPTQRAVFLVNRGYSRIARRFVFAYLATTLSDAPSLPSDYCLDRIKALTGPPMADLTPSLSKYSFSDSGGYIHRPRSAANTSSAPESRKTTSRSVPSDGASAGKPHRPPSSAVGPVRSAEHLPVSGMDGQACSPHETNFSEASLKHVISLSVFWFWSNQGLPASVPVALPDLVEFHGSPCLASLLLARCPRLCRLYLTLKGPGSSVATLPSAPRVTWVQLDDWQGHPTELQPLVGKFPNLHHLGIYGHLWVVAPTERRPPVDEDPPLLEQLVSLLSSWITEHTLKLQQIAPLISSLVSLIVVNLKVVWFGVTIARSWQPATDEEVYDALEHQDDHAQFENVILSLPAFVQSAQAIAQDLEEVWIDIGTHTRSYALHRVRGRETEWTRRADQPGLPGPPCMPLPLNLARPYPSRSVCYAESGPW